MDLKNFFLPNITKDTRGNMIYYERYLKTTFRVPQKQQSIFTLLKNRLLYILLFSLFLYTTEFKTSLVLLIGIGLYIISSFLLYKVYLPKLYPITTFDVFKDRKPMTQRDRIIRFILIGLYFLSIGLVIYLGFKEKDFVFGSVAILYTVYATYQLIQNYYLLNLNN